MTEQELAEKRITVSFEFSRYLIAHPDLAERLPEDVAVVFFIEDDPEFTDHERQLATQLAAAGQPLVRVRIRGLAPPLESRLIEPTLELRSL
ncbi:MAG: hypothetical protein HYZ89_03075 [Candidatus Omnitrophica bacterium]|nr:hypothetical protein [Candidatus Omnitrophota bacterium]